MQLTNSSAQQRLYFPPCWRCHKALLCRPCFKTFPIITPQQRTGLHDGTWHQLTCKHLVPLRSKGTHRAYSWEFLTRAGLQFLVSSCTGKRCAGSFSNIISQDRMKAKQKQNRQQRTRTRTLVFTPKCPKSKH